MSVFAVGDIHGCRQTLDDLLAHIGFNPAVDVLWLVGDLVNRGPDSLGVLRWAHAHRRCIKIVLGNHDLHLLAARARCAKAGQLAEILAAPDAGILCDWLREQPLLWAEGDYVLLHAGRLPEWGQQQALRLAAEASARLRQDDDFFAAMYGDTPACWHPALGGVRRHRLIVNAFTRLRIVTTAGGMALGYSGVPAQRPPQTVPWFDAPAQLRWPATTICGHWSSLGLVVRKDLLAIDTGCLWGGQLTAVRLEDRKVYQVPARPAEVVACGAGRKKS